MKQALALGFWPTVIAGLVGWWLYTTFTGVSMFFQAIVAHYVMR